jgi:hypothetical protein
VASSKPLWAVRTRAAVLRALKRTSSRSCDKPCGVRTPPSDRISPTGDEIVAGSWSKELLQRTLIRGEKKPGNSGFLPSGGRVPPSPRKSRCHWPLIDRLKGCPCLMATTQGGLRPRDRRGSLLVKAFDSVRELPHPLLADLLAEETHRAGRQRLPPLDLLMGTRV